MAAKPKAKFMGRNGGVVHVVHTKAYDMKNSKCVSLKKGHEDGVWKGKGLSPEAALELKPCTKCETHDVAEVERKARMTPAQKRAETVRVRNETIDSVSKTTRSKKHKADKPAKVARRGPKRADAGDRMKAIVEENAAFAKEHGWKATASETNTNEWTAEAKRSGETLKLIYRDGRKTWARVVLASGVEVRLRTVENWQKHASGKSGIKPDYAPKVTRQGKKASKAVVIDDAKPRKLPFSLEDDDETVIESLVGKTITWRNSVSNTLETATLPQRARNCRVTDHPKSERRMVSFYEHQGQNEHGEMLGGERTVYIDKILKAR